MNLNKKLKLCSTVNARNCNGPISARDEAKGNAAVQSLKSEGWSPKFHQLDVCNTDSISEFRDHLKHEYEGLDVLINNAGLAWVVVV